MLFHPLDAVLGSTAKVRIIRALLPLASPVSASEVRQLSGIRSASGLRAALDDLTELGVLERYQTGRIKLFRLNRDHDLHPQLAALFDAEGRRMAALRQMLRDTVDEGAVREHTLSIILFGSNARGDARPRSDVDLLVVTRDESSLPGVRDALIGAMPAVEHRFGFPISPLVLARERVRERYRDGDPLMRSIESEGRTVFGAPFPELVGP